MAHLRSLLLASSLAICLIVPNGTVRAEENADEDVWEAIPPPAPGFPAQVTDGNSGIRVESYAIAIRFAEVLNREEKRKARRAEREAKKAEKSGDGLMTTEEGPCANPNPLALC